MYGSNRTFRHQELGALPTGGDHVWVPAFSERGLTPHGSGEGEEQERRS